MPDAHLRTPAAKPRARALGVPLPGQPGRAGAITDVPVGYTTRAGPGGVLVRYAA